MQTLAGQERLIHLCILSVLSRFLSYFHFPLPPPPTFLSLFLLILGCRGGVGVPAALRRADGHFVPTLPRLHVRRTVPAPHHLRPTHGQGGQLGIPSRVRKLACAGLTSKHTPRLAGWLATGCCIASSVSFSAILDVMLFCSAHLRFFVVAAVSDVMLLFTRVCFSLIRHCCRLSDFECFPSPSCACMCVKCNELYRVGYFVAVAWGVVLLLLYIFMVITTLHVQLWPPNRAACLQELRVHARYLQPVQELHLICILCQGDISVQYLYPWQQIIHCWHSRTPSFGKGTFRRSPSRASRSLKSYALPPRADESIL